ncbi:MAG: protein kinase [Myxococcales bacterium]
MSSPADPSEPPVRAARQGPWSAAAAARDRNSLRAAFQEGDTLDVHVPVSPPLIFESDSKIYLRAYTFGVTEEAKGRYRAEPDGELGRGAIGRVFVAEDLHLGRRVAIKELLSEGNELLGDSRALQGISRFLREARVTGVLEHPNIVPVYELGRRADGTLYYTMRIVPGRTLAQAIGESKGIQQRLSLVNHFSGLCQAIAYAHSRGIVHRDIKPDNVMVGEFGETVVLDWGMAKLLVQPLDETDATEISLAPEPAPARELELDDPGLTLEGSLCGTPLYMSPEQAAGRSNEVDFRSDVWSLGVVLYTILSGRTPFSGKSLLEIIAKVRAGQHTPLRAHDPRIPAELAAIVEHALRPNPEERYASARELARDVQAYQAGMRVTAYEYSSFDLVQRFVARHRAAVTASLLAVIFAFVAGIVAYRRVVAARDRALVAERRALDNELSARHSAEHARHSLGEVLLERAQQALQEGNSVDAELLAARSLEQEERADARGIVLAAQSAPRPTLSYTLGAKGCTRSALSLSAGIFGCSSGHELRLWSLSERRIVRSVALGGEPSALAFASDASALAVATPDGSLRVRPLSFGDEPWRTESCGSKPSAVAVAAGGRVLACAAGRGLVTVWRAGSVTRWELGQVASALALSKDGSVLAVGGELGALVVYQTSDHSERRLEGHSGTVLSLTLAEQGRYLASGGADRMVRLWDTVSGKPLQPPIAHSDAVDSLSWSDDRRFLTLGGADRTLRVLDLRSGRGALARQHDEAVELAAISGDGTELASYSRDVGLRSWTLPSARRPTELDEHGNVLALGLGSGPEQLLSAGLGRNGVCLWDLSNGSCGARLPVRLDRVRALAISNDRTILALAGSGSQIFVWDLAKKIPTQVIAGLRDETRALAFSRDGRTLTAAGLDRKLRLFDVASAALILERETNAPVQTMSIAPESGLLFTGDQAGVLSVWDPKTLEAKASWQAHADWVLGGAISADGTLYASAGADRSIKIWNAQTRKHLLTLLGHAGKVLSVDFSADGRLLVSAGEDKSVRLWDSHSGKALATLVGHSGIVRAVRFTDQPALLASGSDDGVIRLWHIEALTRSGADLEAAISRQFGLEPAH